MRRSGHALSSRSIGSRTGRAVLAREMGSEIIGPRATLPLKASRFCGHVSSTTRSTRGDTRSLCSHLLGGAVTVVVVITAVAVAVSLGFLDIHLIEDDPVHRDIVLQ